MKAICTMICLLVGLGSLCAQTSISGTVTDDATGEPLIGATVLFKGGTGTVTDFDGNYTIDVPADVLTLEYSYVGMQTTQVDINGRLTIDVALEGNLILEEVVVVGYGTEKRSNISGSVAVLSSEEITSTAITRVEQALQGRTAGVQIAPVSGSPGAPLTVRIRGTGTINNADPLYVVDGIPVGGIDYLNPADIESINVLKDAASAAIYGSRGANGVVLITTKSGRGAENGAITYTNNLGFQETARKLNLLNAREYAIISNEARINNGLSPLPQFSNPDLLGEGTDWQEAIFQRAPYSEHQLSLSSATEKSSFVISGGYLDQAGIIGGEKSAFERYTARVNGRSQVKSWLAVGSNLNFTYLQRNLLPENNEFNTPLVRAINMDPTTPVRKSDGTYAYSVYADTDIANPVNAIEQTHDTWTTQRGVGSAFVEIEPIENLVIRSAYSVDATFATRNVFTPRYDLSLDTLLNDAPAAERSEVNSVSVENNTWRNWQWENTVTYNFRLRDVHNFNAVVGNTTLENNHYFNGGAGTGLPSNDPEDAFISNTIDGIATLSSYEGAADNALLSYFGRLSYDYGDRYLFSATFRADGSSRFGANNRFGYFPSVSGGWVVSREDFFSVPAISFLKLRASWGRNGNDRIGDYGFTTVVNIGQNYTFGNDEVITNGAVPLRPSNPDLRWETSTQFDLGIDLELWDGRVGFIADYYQKTTTDMLYRAPIPLLVGALPPDRNIGSVENKGIELALHLRESRRRFTYDIGANISFVDNVVLSLGEGSDPILSGRIQSANGFVARTDVGQPIGAFYGYVTDGIFQTQEEVSAHAFQNEHTQAGDIRFKDLNNDGVIDAEDQTYIGNPTPDFTYGLTANFGYANFDLTIFLQGVHGNEVYNAITRYDFNYVNRPVSVLNRWTGPGTSNTEPRVSISDANQNARVSDRFVEDGSYLRIKNLQLGYTLPRTIQQKLKMQQFRIYGGVQNLLTFTNYSGLDPEIGTRFNEPLDLGIDRGFYPQARTWLTGIQLTF